MWLHPATKSNTRFIPSKHVSSFSSLACSCRFTPDKLNERTFTPKIQNVLKHLFYMPKKKKDQKIGKTTVLSPFSQFCSSWCIFCSCAVFGSPQCPWCGWGAWSHPPSAGWWRAQWLWWWCRSAAASLWAPGLDEDWVHMGSHPADLSISTGDMCAWIQLHMQCHEVLWLYGICVFFIYNICVPVWLSGRALRQQRKRLWVRFPGNTHILIKNV